MKSRLGRLGTVAFVVVLVGVAVAGAAVAALVAHQSLKATKVAVKEVDYKILLKKHTFAPGKYTFVVSNKGHSGHEFFIKGPGVSKRIPGVLNPGNTKSLTVTLRKGSTYKLWCPLHVSLGMKTSIHTTGGTAGGGGTTATTNTTTTGGGWG